MAETTVRNLAEVVGTPVDTLLSQMKDAGLPHTSADDNVSDDQKQVLLAHLRRAHGVADGAEPVRITLKRKTTSTIKTTGASGKAKTVAVEVRKKRTYVKRSVIEEQEKERQEAERLEAERLERERQEAEEAQRQAEEARRKKEEEAHREAEEQARRQAESELSPEELKAAEEKARKAAEEKARRLAVPRKGSKKSAAQIQETPEEKAEREAEEKRKREAEETRRKQESESRRKAEEEAARRTAEEAKRIADELANREQTAAPATEETEDEGSSIVSEAMEASWRDEERITKRRRRRPGQSKILVAHGQMKSSFHKEHGFRSPTEKMIYEVEIPENITVQDLAQRMSMKVRDVIRALMQMGEVATANQYVDQETATLLVEELGHTPKPVKGQEAILEDDLALLVQRSGTAKSRAPVVTIMGHVDHGKTSLLDFIRKSSVADAEAGGITQHIGAYHVETDKGMITFLDTPGHAAFTAMRARGAKATDIVIIVVAADDGVMPQTEEAINHARAAGVPIIVAVNKMDKEQADPDRVKSELSQHEVIPEEWGGDCQFCYVSAHTGEGVDGLLDSILAQADLMELQAVSEGPATGVVLESRVEKGRGAVTSVLVQEGELKLGDMLLAGPYFGRVRAMVDEHGRSIEAAGPSLPVGVLGLDGVADAGEQFLVVSDEKKAREVAEFRFRRDRELKLKRQQASKLENLFSNMEGAGSNQVNIILKADVRGSLEALIGALNDLSTDEVKVNIVSSGVGAINESDVNLAMTSSAVLLGFNVRADNAASRLCEQEGIDLRYYGIIYELIDDVKKALSGLLQPEHREEILGVAEVREVFRSSKFGAVAGCMVVQGTVFRNRRIRVLRDDVVVFEGELESLRRFKDDVPEVRNGMDCGIAVKSYNDVKPGDKIEVYEVREIARTL